jgi:UDP:flavonoid glycosyltransferase YjiC (YdhE family)
MSRILCVWELGTGYGHLGRLLPVALELRQRGHEVVFALRDLTYAEAFLGKRGFRVLQSPVWMGEGRGAESPLNYAELLGNFGFLDEAGLTGMAKAWRELYSLTRPDLLLVDHAPTALLAARGSGIRSALLGPGFASPPRTFPMPSIRPWLETPEALLVEREKRVLSTINGVARTLGAKPLDTLADLFEVEEDFLCTFPELDPYSRTGVRYWGPVFAAEHGVAPVWPQGSTERIFAYLAPRYRDFGRVMDQLVALPYRTLVHAPGLSDKETKKYQTRNVILSPEPVHIVRASHECDLVICHGGTTTCAAALLAGRPVLVLHRQIEQLLLAQGLVTRGLAKTVNPESRTPNYRQMIRDILSDARFAERAREFAAKYADFDLSRQADLMATRCEEIVAGEIHRKE